MNDRPEVTELRLVVTAPDYDQALRFYRDVLACPSAPPMPLPAAG